MIFYSSMSSLKRHIRNDHGVEDEIEEIKTENISENSDSEEEVLATFSEKDILKNVQDGMVKITAKNPETKIQNIENAEVLCTFNLPQNSPEKRAIRKPGWLKMDQTKTENQIVKNYFKKIVKKPIPEPKEEKLAEDEFEVEEILDFRYDRATVSLKYFGRQFFYKKSYQLVSKFCNDIFVSGKRIVSN